MKNTTRKLFALNLALLLACSLLPLPALALETVRTEIEMSSSSWHADDFSIEPAGRDRASEIIYI